MKRKRLIFATVAALCAGTLSAQVSADKQKPLLLVKAARLLDVRAGTYLQSAAVLIEGDRIKQVGRAAEISAPKDAKVIDLADTTLLPGLIDCHTHLLLRIPSGPDGYALNLLTKSQAFRALEGAADARATLRAGFTTVRDVENEGSGYADVALRDAINQGLVEGPRMQVATRAIAALGQYNPFGVSPDLKDFPTGAEMVSGTEDARRAVREQIGHGADLIKVYADWNYPTLTVDEMQVIVEEAHKLHRKVAAHAMTPVGIRNAITAGVDSIEHGHYADRQDLELMREKGVYLVPTVSGIDANSAPEIAVLISGARELGVKIANGSDADSAKTHGDNAEELVAMTKRGLTPLEAIRAATVNAAELMSWQERVGTIEAGKYADLIAVIGDPLQDVSVLRRVAFVMKGGEIVRSDKK